MSPRLSERECACVSDDAARCLEQRERGFVLTEDDEEYSFDRDECHCVCHCVDENDDEWCLEGDASTDASDSLNGAAPAPGRLAEPE